MKQVYKVNIVFSFKSNITIRSKKTYNLIIGFLKKNCIEGEKEEESDWIDYIIDWKTVESPYFRFVSSQTYVELVLEDISVIGVNNETNCINIFCR